MADKKSTRRVSRRTAFAEALERIDLLTQVRAVDREEQVLRPKTAKDLRRLQGGLWNVNEVLPLRGELRDWLVAEIERGQPVAFSGEAWLNDTADRVQFLLGPVNRMSVPPPPTGRPVAQPREVVELIQRIWRDILGRRRSRTVDIEDHIPHGPLIDFTKACLGLVGIKLSANAINSHLGRLKKRSKLAK